MREQTREAKEFARGKCSDIDVRLRAELDESIPKMLAALEAKLLSPFGMLEARVKAL